MVYHLSLDDIKTLADAQLLCKRLINEAIEAVTSSRGRNGKIRRCSLKMTRLKMWCTTNGHSQVAEELSKNIDMLEETKADNQSNLYNI